MKKLLLLLTCITGITYTNSYNQWKSEVKKALYHNKQNLIKNSNDYSMFIEKYLTEAETSLAILHTASQKENLTLYDMQLLNKYSEYIQLADFFIFKDIQKVYAADRMLQSNVVKNFLETITNIKNAWNLNIDPEVELKQTFDIFYKVNQDFYNQLSKSERLKIRFKTSLKNFNEKYLYLLSFGF